MLIIIDIIFEDLSEANIKDDLFYNLNLKYIIIVELNYIKVNDII